MSEIEHGQGENLVVAFRAPNEYVANVVRGLLVSEGVPAILESRQVAWMDGLMTMGEGYWGDVVVPEQLLVRSRELIAAYQSSMTDEEITEAGESS